MVISKRQTFLANGYLCVFSSSFDCQKFIAGLFCLKPGYEAGITFYRNLRALKDLSETEKNFQLVLKNRRKSRKKKSGCKSHLYYMGTTLKCKYEFFACIET